MAAETSLILPSTTAFLGDFRYLFIFLMLVSDFFAGVLPWFLIDFRF